jgi:hypothetical protein
MRVAAVLKAVDAVGAGKADGDAKRDRAPAPVAAPARPAAAADVKAVAVAGAEAKAAAAGGPAKPALPPAPAQSWSERLCVERPLSPATQPHLHFAARGSVDALTGDV